MCECVDVPKVRMQRRCQSHFLKVLRRAEKACYLDPSPPSPVFVCCVCFIKTHHLFLLILPLCLCVSPCAGCLFVFVKEFFVLESQ